MMPERKLFSASLGVTGEREGWGQTLEKFGGNEFIPNRSILIWTCELIMSHVTQTAGVRTDEGSYEPSELGVTSHEY